MPLSDKQKDALAKYKAAVEKYLTEGMDRVSAEQFASEELSGERDSSAESSAESTKQKTPEVKKKSRSGPVIVIVVILVIAGIVAWQLNLLPRFRDSGTLTWMDRDKGAVDVEYSWTRSGATRTNTRTGIGERLCLASGTIRNIGNTTVKLSSLSLEMQTKAGIVLHTMRTSLSAVLEPNGRTSFSIQDYVPRGLVIKYRGMGGRLGYESQ